RRGGGGVGGGARNSRARTAGAGGIGGGRGGLWGPRGARGGSGPRGGGRRRAGPPGGVEAWGRAGGASSRARRAAAVPGSPAAEVEERGEREVRAQADSPERLLVAWINECLYVHEIEGFVVRRVEVDACTETVVHGVLHGEEFDGDRHRFRATVKAATLRGA